LSEILEALSTEPNIASFAVLVDGKPHVTPVWIDYEDGKLIVNTAEGRVKARAVRENPSVGVMIIDRNNPYRWISVIGKVVEVTEEGAQEHIDRMAKKYLGQETYPFRRPGEIRLIIRIEPERELVFRT
jgi:PPOX class probable F420-dependent enzyme